MPLSGTVREVTHFGLAFDSNGVLDDLKTPNKLTLARAQAFRAAGFAFCARYVPRDENSVHDYDLTASEAGTILGTGLGLMPVQHVDKAGWKPSGDLGQRYGAFAARYARDVVGFPAGVSLFVDLEGVNAATPKQQILDYCTEWKKEVAAAGYSPGLYTGDAMHINAKNVGDLDFNHYWLAYTEEFSIPGRAFQMHQFTWKKFRELHPAFQLKGVSGFAFQVDTLMVEPARGSVRYLAG